MRSIRIKHLEVLLKDIVKAMRQEGRAEPQFGFTSQDLKEYFLENDIYLAETYKDRYRDFFSNELPFVMVTHMWLVTPIEKLLQILMERNDKECHVFVDIFIYRQIQLHLFPTLEPTVIRLLTCKLFGTACLAFISCIVFPTSDSWSLSII